MFSRPSFIYNNAAQTIYTFTVGGLAVFMPTFFQRERHLPLDEASPTFGGILCLAGFLGTLVGGRLNERLAARTRTAAFDLSAYGLIASLALHGARDPVAAACYLLASDWSRCS